MKENNMVNQDKNKEVKRRNMLLGKVVSQKMKDTAVVLVEGFKRHPKYGKFYKVRKKYKVHDPGNTKKVGERVAIEESRPISKDKHFVLVEKN
ncbi:MAG: small subunit ribosomal protein S17 [Parcubacteria group bacterium Gr01-1014_107]|nr:MAG: small subunit ribosomal protein S17 [Parcubacteria group bacterium Gr01-1014_107]